MKKLLLAIITLLVLLSGCSTHTASSKTNKVTTAKQELIVKTYTIESIDNEGYYATGNNEGVYFTKQDTKLNLQKGNKVKVTFTKKQYETMEGVTKVELIN
jgi:uncharacterized protein YcfL